MENTREISRQLILVDHWLGWRSALIWGIGAALIHRLVLLVWMAAVWVALGANMSSTAEIYRKPGLSPLADTPLTQFTLGVWRRWDAVHYLGLAESGYQLSDPGPTVFGVLTPLGIGLFDHLLPGPVDTGAMVFATLTFAVALALLYRLCEAYYEDSGLAQRAVILTTILPLAYFLSAPMSEALYLATVMGVFYAGAQGKWGWAAIAGVLATLTRTQGVLLAAIAGLMLLQQANTPLLMGRIFEAVRKGWALIFVPVSFFAFIWFRRSQGFPPLEETYAKYSYVYFANPVEGLLTNFRWMVEHPGDAVWNIDLWMLVIVLVLGLLQLRYPLHRRLPLAIYTWASILIFITKLNWGWGTSEPTYTQSFARYALLLFPLTVLAADRIRWLSRWKQRVLIGVLGAGLAVFSALHALGIGPA